MEMTSSGAGAVTTKLDVDDDYPMAATAEPPCPPATERKRCRRRRVLVVASLVTLPLLAFFVLRRERSSTAWLQTAIAKLTAMNDDDGGAGFMDADDPPHGGGGHNNELLGGLLPPGMDRRSCRSRYQSSWYYKHFPFAPSRHLLEKLRAYEARHRRCAPGTPQYARSIEQLRSGHSAAAAEGGMEECRYVVWLPFDGLGNRMLSMVSAFLYALLTDRVLLAALPPDSAALFCEPFPGATWRLPADDDFPVANLFRVGQDMEQSYTRLVVDKKVGLGPPPAANATATATTTTVPPSYVYLSLGWLLRDGIFFCGEHQRVLGKINWLLLYSDLYFAPSLYAVAEFHDELRRLFPEKESVHHLLSRYLLHPANPVWSLVTRYYRSYLAPATRRIGVQVRMFGFASIPADDMYDQILNCSRQEHILPETDDAATPTAAATGGGHGNSSNNNSTAIFVASLYADYYKRLRSRYSAPRMGMAKAGGGGGSTSTRRVGVFQRTHEERQATENLAHNQRALAEIYLLSFSEELITSGLSTFGYVSSSLAGVRPAILLTAFDHKVPETPCRRAVSVEPCNLTPPRGLECQGKPVDKEDLARHVRVCEDFKNGVKFFD